MKVLFVVDGNLNMSNWSGTTWALYSEMRELYGRNHFLVFPTHAECAGAVISESGSYGLPVFVNATGGTPSLVSNGENGFLLSLDMKEWEKVITRYSDKPEEYRELRESSYQYYQKSLNWNVICRNIWDVMAESIAGQIRR